MKKKVTAAAALALCVAMGVCACSTPKENDAFTGEKKEDPAWQANLDKISPEVYADISDLDLEPGTYISVIGKREGTSYWNEVQAGVEQAAADINKHLGYKGEDKIKVLYNAPSDSENIDEQVNILDEELARYPDVIAVASVAEDASAVQFDLAAENGIAVVAFDSKNSYQGIQCTCMTDNTAEAKEGAQKLGEAIDGKGEIILIAQDSVSGTAKERTKAVADELAANYPEVKIVETIYMDQLEELKMQAAAEELGVTKEELAAWTVESSGQDTAEEVAQDTASETIQTKLEDIHAIADGMKDADVAAYYMEKHPELKGCFAVNADAVLLAMDAVDIVENAEDIVLMGFDAGKEQVAALKDGKVDGLIVQNPFGMGYATVVAAARATLEIGNEANVNTGYVWADKESLDDPVIKGMLYE